MSPPRLVVLDTLGKDDAHKVVPLLSLPYLSSLLTAFRN